MAVFYVFLGGGLGCVLRYLISKFSLSFIKSSLPIATFISNMISCLILAMVLVWIKSKTEDVDNNLRLFLVVGFCGGLSTFSTFSLETVELVKSGSLMAAFLNVLISVMFGFAIIYFILNKGN